MNISEKKIIRYEFLNKLYEITDGDSSLIVNMWELGKEINIERKDISNIVDYLKGEYLIEPMTLGGGISITHEGILEIEELHNSPDVPTIHFPAINVIHVENMNNSAIQQGNANSNQNILFEQAKSDDLQKVILEIERIKNNLNLENEDAEELESELATIKSQSKSPKPKKIIIAESLKTIRNLVEGVAGNAIAPTLIEMINGLI
ncbi:hypothetical protein [Labilibacter marinus]|uniref:hypothetical protein n=1 Tax=Labilibacter marinus TaxID=1477105 RepID=UPI0008366326|nr:hypothetical protein [Labilibacter marinus]